MEVVNAPNSREAENINPTENAISAATKILKFNSSSVNINEILPIWYANFPTYQLSMHVLTQF